MKSAETSFPMLLEEEEEASSTVGSQKEEEEQKEKPPSAIWEFDLDVMLNIDIDDLPDATQSSEKEEAVEATEDEEQPRRRTLVEEMEWKYGREQGVYAADSRVFIKQRRSPGKSGAVCLPGKRTASGGLALLMLDNRDIQETGPFHQLARLAAELQEADLAGNELRWPAVAAILAAMPLLHHANFSRNPLHLPPAVFPAHLVLPKMRSLVLNSTAISWTTLFTLLPTMP